MILLAIQHILVVTVRIEIYNDFIWQLGSAQQCVLIQWRRNCLLFLFWHTLISTITYLFCIHRCFYRKAWGSIISRTRCNGDIAYASLSLWKGEKNCPTHKMEFLSLKWVVTLNFHYFLHCYSFEQTRSIKNICGRANRNADSLSRVVEFIHGTIKSTCHRLMLLSIYCNFNVSYYFLLVEAEIYLQFIHNSGTMTSYYNCKVKRSSSRWAKLRLSWLKTNK